MPTRNINLTDHYDGFLAEQLSVGRYNNASEVVRAGLRLLEQQEAEDIARLEALRKASAIGAQAYENGDFTVIESDEALDHLFDEISADADQRS
jgi:antitoxin ParD1/3/4